jgi:hypothetical protein
MLTHLYNLILAETSDKPFQSLLDLSPNDRLPVVIVTIVFSAGIIVASVAIIGGLLHTYHRHRLQADLKRELLDRGLSPDEVVRVIQAAPAKNGVDGRRVS